MTWFGFVVCMLASVAGKGMSCTSPSRAGIPATRSSSTSPTDRRCAVKPNGCSAPVMWGAANNRPVGVDLGGGYVGFDRGRDLLAKAASKGLARAFLHPALQIGRRRADREGQMPTNPVPTPSTGRTRAVVGGQGEFS